MKILKMIKIAGKQAIITVNKIFNHRRYKMCFLFHLSNSAVTNCGCVCSEMSHRSNFVFFLRNIIIILNSKGKRPVFFSVLICIWKWWLGNKLHNLLLCLQNWSSIYKKVENIRNLHNFIQFFSEYFSLRLNGLFC